MFSSNDYSNNNNGVYPLALYLSSLSSYEHNIPSASYSHHQHQNPQNLHPNNPLLAAPCDHQFSSPSMPESLIDYMSFSSNNVMMEQNLVNGGCSNQVEALMAVKKPVKKDRHSKIQTAQGLRDRRVRLSIGIARQFFDLQDMLGFDKASKTLEWLLKKSRKAISEIVHTKKLNGSNFSDANIQDEFFVNNIVDETEGKEEEEEEEEDEYRSFLSGSSSEYCEDAVFETKKQECGGPVHKDKRKKNESDNILSKGLRAKARERAKERARDKIGSRNTEHTKTVFEITQSQILDSLRSTNGDEGEEKLPERVHGEDMAHSLYDQPIKELNAFSGYLANQESNFIRRTIKPLTLSATEQQNGELMLKDQICSSNNINILPQNWDIYDPNPFVDPPFGALSNMNESTRLQ